MSYNPSGALNQETTDALFSSVFNTDSLFLRTLRPLLKALNWHGTDHQLAQTLPHLYPTLNLSGFLRIMRLLGFQAKTFKATIQYLDARFNPCVYISDDSQKVYLLKEKTLTGWLVFSPSENKELILESDEAGRIYIFEELKEETDISVRASDTNWLSILLKRFKGLFVQVFVIGLMLNLLVLTTPFFVMSVYDLVISTASYQMLIAFVIGVIIAFIGMFALQLIRAKLLAYIGAKLDLYVGNAIIKRILFLPARYTESGNIGGQISRIKDFDMVREFFTGQLMVLFLDLPFVIIFIITIAALAGYMVIIPIITLFVFGIFILIMRPIVRRTLVQTATSTAQYHQFLLEALTNLKTIKYSSAQTLWFNRFKSLCAERAQVQYKMSNIDNVVMTISDAIMILSALGVLTFGAFLILSQSISIGGMIASMILVWRIIIPLKSLFVTFAKLDQIKLSFHQINNLMRIPPEKSQSIYLSKLNHIKGRITLSNISLRYPGQSESALLNISAEIPPGKMLGITGKSGSGKSTLLKAILKLYPIQSGKILLDGCNIEQIDSDELRQTISYIPQKTMLFYGTIEQNLRLVHPTASEDQIWQVLSQVGLKEEINTLERGLKTQIKDHNQVLSGSFLQRLNIARALLKNSKIILINDASDALDIHNDELFINLLKNLKNKVTVILISQRPSHLRITDQVMILDQGKMVAGGKSEDMIKLILQGLKK
ncbi:peptidase domain-containing ABC transporter [Thiotrichales bacterium 19S3-7]|nr:peptidase domain-containing ABC transporter [Thiotrichales bacterium 19S3-7]MCF6801380.1 peptidase domain-containing ABC transporter [Thiotrichales bacterium 19S3-11]